MKNVGTRFYRLRGLFLIFFTKILSKLFFVEMPPAVSVSALIIKENKLLAVKLSFLKGYALPGGHVKNFESFEEALRREVEEETGLKISQIRYFNSYNERKSFLYNILNVCFLANVTGNLSFSSEGEPEWVEKRELIKNLVYLDNKRAVEDFIKENL